MKTFCFICGVLGSFLILSTVQAAFIDVPSNQANYEAINYVQGKKIVQGYSDGSFKPNNPINRAELTKIIMATNFGSEELNNCNTASVGLTDVPVSAWFASSVCLAKNKNIIKGYSDGTFKPAQNVTFVESAKIISLGFGQNLPEDSEIWYRPYVNYLSAQSAIPSSVDSMAKNITRGEMAEMIYRLHAAVENRPAQAFAEGELKPMTDELKAQQKSAIKSANHTSQISSNATVQSTTSTNTTTSSSSVTTSSSASNQPNTTVTLLNPMVCKNCPAGTIGQPTNNCACETAYIYEQTYPIDQCNSVEYVCGSGYKTFTEPTQCGCKLKETVLEYWLATDASFKMNALDDAPPILHGTYQDLTAQTLETALGKKNMILFFHADWCPSCVATNQEIKDRITELPEDAVIFKTNYDTETTLRQKFEITAQHSMVIIDKKNALQFKQTGFNFDDIINVLEKMEEAESL